MPEPVKNGRTIAIGDIHGCDRALNVLIDRLMLSSMDRVVILGDAIDRGAGSRAVLEKLLQIRQTCNLVYLLGNHEEMMLDALNGSNIGMWMRHGGAATLASYAGNLKNVPDSHLELLNSAVEYWSDPASICVHANLEPGVKLDQQRGAWLRWRKLRGSEFPPTCGRTVICGHTGVSYETPSVRNGWVCLDTMPYEGGYLSAADLVTGEVFQSQQSGEFRRGLYLHEIEANASKRLIPDTAPLQPGGYSSMRSVFKRLLMKMAWDPVVPEDLH